MCLQFDEYRYFTFTDGYGYDVVTSISDHMYAIKAQLDAIQAERRTFLDFIRIVHVLGLTSECSLT